MSVRFGEAHLVIKIRKIGVRCIEIVHELGRTEVVRVGYAAVVHHQRHRHQYRLHLEIFIYTVQLILLISLWIFEDARREIVGLAVVQRSRSTTHHQWHHLRRVRNVWRWNDVVIHRQQVAVPSVQRVATRSVHMIHIGVGGHVVRQCCGCNCVIQRMILR